jgi:hypothetical protein
MPMRYWKLIGYIFVCLGTLFFSYGFLVGITETINPANAAGIGTLDSSVASFFSLFLSATAPWVILASAMFVIGGFGLYFGRNKNAVKSKDAEIVLAKLDKLETTIQENFEAISKRLDAIENQLKNP